MVSFEIFVKSMPPSLSELKVTPSFCFAFKIPDDPTTTSTYNKTTFFPEGKDGDVKIDDISAKTMKLLLIFIYKDILAKSGLISECYSLWLKSPKQGTKSLS